MRKCKCSGACGPQNDGLTRREFIGLVGAGTATALLGTPAWGAFSLSTDEWERWRRELMQPAQPRLYRSNIHTDARLHLGGIGTGNFEIGADGQFTTWQLFNTLRDGYVPFYFAVKVGDTAKLLQTAGGPDLPRIKEIEMTGEYPFAVLRFRDAELPVQLQLTAFSPFAPLDAKLSSMPLAAFVFQIHNPTGQPQTVSLAAMMQNPVGYDSLGAPQGVAHGNYGGNVNEVLREGRANGLFLCAQPGQDATLDQPVSILASSNLGGLLSPPPDRPKNLGVQILTQELLGASQLKEPAHTVIWLEESPADLAAPLLRAAQEAVQAGATLLFSGRTLPLLRSYALATSGKPLEPSDARPDILFEDFENGYEKWKVEGTAFGEKPAHGTLPNQQRVSGFLGQGLVNSFLQGDSTTGRLISKEFQVERHFIRFLIGGGHHSNTQFRLVAEEKVVRAASGKDNERLESMSWDVQELAGRTAHLEIVDEAQGGWGHINVDQIEFTDQPGNREVLALLEDLLPARFSDVVAEQAIAGNPNQVKFKDLEQRPGAQASKAANGLNLIAGSHGKGKVLLAAGTLLAPSEAELTNPRQRAFALLCELVGAKYVAPDGACPKTPGFGTLALAAIGESTTVTTSFEDWQEAWKTFVKEGHFEDLDHSKPNAPTAIGHTVNGAVGTTVTVPAGGTLEIPFLLGWHFPNKYNGDGEWMGCHYATQWPDARAVVRDAAASFATMRTKTELFRRTLYESSLPYWLLDCLSANAAIIRHIGVVFRIGNGDIFGWEGSNGCCQPTCTHVWGYEQSLARLFPALEKEMRRIDFKHQQRADGGVNNRTDVPSPAHPTGEQPFADGHASCILKAYREALNHPDEAFFQDYWPHIKRGVDYLIDRDAKTSGGQPSGVLQDDQWNTYDEALHGVTTFIGTYYLAALRAGEEWAKRVGDSTSAQRFRSVFELGQKKLVELCWNGEYFQQNLSDYLKRSGEVGPGCMADQLIGQWWAHQLGLGYLLPKEKMQSALRAVFKHNWKSDLTGWRHAPRAFAGARDKGLIICTWPRGGRPDNVMLYSDEVWTGIEYQVAAHLLYEGLIEEGLAVVKGARDRYDGAPRAPIPRNPWNEIECGGHYARAMSSWSLLLALSGYEYDGPRKMLRFTPRHTPENFKALFCAPEGWGSLRQTRKESAQISEIALRDGRFGMAQITVAPPFAPKEVVVRQGNDTLPATFKIVTEGVLVELAKPVTLLSGDVLTITLA
jgi:non-lysosomal glucosylceramidase